ncbi:MAG: DUF2273 domain-containing protein [Clostridiales bacterium]|nr:DUF2273 domain-containing protein [Clostridiales bacterium]
MMDLKTFMSQMLTAGTRPCALFGALVGLIFAVLCLTIGVGKALLIGVFCLIGAFIGGVKDKAGFLKGIILFFHRDDADRYE